MIRDERAPGLLHVIAHVKAATLMLDLLVIMLNTCEIWCLRPTYLKKTTFLGTELW